MNLPKTTEFSLKQIVENMGAIPDKMGQVKPPMTPEMKRQLKEMAYMFREYGKSFEDEKAIVESAKVISQFMELAQNYAINECPDVFQENIIKKNFADCSKKVQELQKIAQECYVKKQHCAILFDDIRHIVERYYKVAPAEKV